MTFESIQRGALSIALTAAIVTQGGCAANTTSQKEVEQQNSDVAPFVVAIAATLGVSVATVEAMLMLGSVAVVTSIALAAQQTNWDSDWLQSPFELRTADLEASYLGDANAAVNVAAAMLGSAQYQHRIDGLGIAAAAVRDVLTAPAHVKFQLGLLGIKILDFYRLKFVVRDEAAAAAKYEEVFAGIVEAGVANPRPEPFTPADMTRMSTVLQSVNWQPGMTTDELVEQTFKQKYPSADITVDHADSGPKWMCRPGNQWKQRFDSNFPDERWFKWGDRQRPYLAPSCKDSLAEAITHAGVAWGKAIGKLVRWDDNYFDVWNDGPDVLSMMCSKTNC